MIRSGSLKERIIIEAPITTENEWGTPTKEYKEIFRCRAYRKKQSVMRGDENAKESFLGQMAILTTRKYPDIVYGNRIRWAGCLWEIRMIETLSNEMALTLKKINQ